MTTEQERTEFNTYLENLSEGKRSALQDLDKHTLTLASGALTLSIAVVQLSAKALQATEDLRWAWTHLILSIGSTVLSLGLGAIGFWYRDAAVRESYKAGTDWRGPRARPLRYVTRSLTLLGPLFFCTGLAYLAIFTFSNIHGSGEGGTVHGSATGTSHETTAKTDSAQASQPTPSKAIISREAGR